MKVVVDTNVLVSAILSPSGPPAQILDLILSRRIILLISHAILSEYSEVLNRKEFSFDIKLVSAFLHILMTYAEKVTASACSIHLPDPDDEPFLACAISGNADFLITGNKKHFPEASCHPIKPVSPAEFLADWTDLS